MRAPRSLDSSTTTFRNKEEAFLELVASEERYLNSLKTFVEVSSSVKPVSPFFVHSCRMLITLRPARA